MAEAGSDQEAGSDEVLFHYKTQAGPSKEKADDKAENQSETDIHSQKYWVNLDIFVPSYVGQTGIGHIFAQLRNNSPNIW